MSTLTQQIDSIKQAVQNFKATNEADVENFRIHYLGSKGVLKTVMAQLKNVAVDDKKAMGLQVNNLKSYIEQVYQNLQNSIQAQSKTTDAASGDDYTLPGTATRLGSRHPINNVLNKITDIFSRLSFSIAEGPEIEDDFHNFTALNISEYHPARDMQDTFYVNKNPDWMLRTHTSSVQIRELQKGQLPLRIICPGRVYRNETISARAHCFFHQVEGLYVDENVSFADLKQTLYFFVKEMFGQDVKVRFRPSYFPFTEPSAEMDVTCFICNGKGCNVCKHTGWVEILGCGMVHPKVLENCGVDPIKYTGYAFGMGIERITMLMYGVNDLRLFSENDMRFLYEFRAID